MIAFRRVFVFIVRFERDVVEFVSLFTSFSLLLCFEAAWAFLVLCAVALMGGAVGLFGGVLAGELPGTGVRFRSDAGQLRSL